MIRVVLTHVPVGSTVNDAQRFLEQEGFQCSRHTNDTFQGHKGVDYIYCDREGGWLIYRRWQLAIVHRDGKVVEVLASTGLVWP